MKIQARDLQPGDRVYDIWGNTHEVVDTRLIRGGKTMSFKRDDLNHREHFDADETITIVTRSET